MASAVAFEGVYPILVTPFDDQDKLDLPSLDRLVRFMADLGMDGVTVLGVLGEANRMLDSEREAVIKTAVAAASSRIAVIVGTSHPGSAAARGLSQVAESLGAAAVMVTPAAEAVPNEQRVFEYFQHIADAISIPIVVQDHPASTQVHMSVALLLRLINEIPTVACIKEEALPTPPKIRSLVVGMKARRVPILTGLGALYGIFDLESGSSGFNTGFAFPEVLAAMIRMGREGRLDKARLLYQHFLPLIVFEQQPGVGIRKEILRLRGTLATNRVRHPGAAIDAATAAQLRTLLDQVLPGVDLTQPLAL